MTFDTAGNLYGTDIQAGCPEPQTACTARPAGAVIKYDSAGNFVSRFTGGPMEFPESIVQSNTGNFYVGQLGPGVFIPPEHRLLKFDSSGRFVSEFSPAVESRGVDGVDLAADQCTLFYTSQGKRVLRFDVCQNRQLPDLATLPILVPLLRVAKSRSSFYPALQRRGAGRGVGPGVPPRPYGQYPSGVSHPGCWRSGTHRLGVVCAQSHRDGTSFWTAIQGTGPLFKVDINTGKVLTEFIAQPANAFGVNGLAVFGEQRAAEESQPG